MGDDTLKREISVGGDANKLLFDNNSFHAWMATAQAAAYLNISPNALRIMVHRGKVKTHKLGSRLRFQIQDLRECLSNKEK
jgi:excisionase family DNA binding protein